MKIIGGILLLIFLFVMFSGCEDIKPTEGDMQSNIYSESDIFSESDYEISKAYLSGEYLDKSCNELKIPKEKLYMESDGAFGFSDLCFFGIQGNATMLVNEGKTTNITFCTKGCKETAELIRRVNVVNDGVAKALGTNKKEFELNCSDKSLEQFEAVLSGKGIMKTSYETDKYTLDITVIATNGEAVISLVQYKQ